MPFLSKTYTILFVRLASHFITMSFFLSFPFNGSLGAQLSCSWQIFRVQCNNWTNIVWFSSIIEDSLCEWLHLMCRLSLNDQPFFFCLCETSTNLNIRLTRANGPIFQFPLFVDNHLEVKKNLKNCKINAEKRLLVSSVNCLNTTAQLLHNDTLKMATKQMCNIFSFMKFIHNRQKKYAHILGCSCPYQPMT